MLGRARTLLERAILGALMSAVAFVVERRLLKALASREQNRGSARP